MFPFWKRKRAVEDEPLVPHGMVWYATDSSEDPQSTPAKESSLQVTLREKAAQEQTSEPLHPVRVERDVNANQRPEPMVAVNRIGAISPPKAWPSPRVQELTRRAQNETAIQGANALRVPLETPPAPVIRETPTVVVRQQAPVIVPSPNTEPADAPPQNGTDIPRAKTNGFADFFAMVGQEFSEARWLIAEEFSTLYARAEERYRNLMLHNRVRRNRSALLHRAADARTRLAPASDQAKARLTDLSNSATATARQGLSRSTFAISRSVAFSRQTLTRAWHHPVRIRIRANGLQKARSLFAGLNQRLTLSNSARRNSRLWTSMAMATLSALLALAVVTGVRPYKTRANTSTSNQTANSVNMQKVVAPAPTVPVRSKRHAIKASAVKLPLTEPTVASQGVDTAPGKPATRRTRLREEDDYVAKDTYVVYGADGKAVRR
jgi:hypothetical protein